MPTVDGPRACTQSDLPEVITLVDSALRRGTCMEDQSMLTDYPLVYRQRNWGYIRILKVDGKTAAVVPFLPHDVVMEECRFKIGVISPTATAIQYRRRGYGSQCLRSCVEAMELGGLDLSILWTRVETFPFYQTSDFEAVRTQGWSYRCTRKDVDLFQSGDEKIVEYDPKTTSYLHAIQRLHERDVYGVLRTDEEYPALFSLPKMKTLIGLRNSAPVAYLVISDAPNKPGLIEGGGDEHALETLVYAALSELGENAFLDAHDNLTATPLGSILERKLASGKRPSRESMMVRINLAGAFLRKISTWLARRNRSVSSEFSIGIAGTADIIGLRFSEDGLELTSCRCNHHFELSRRELTAVIFGAHSTRPTAVPAIMSDLFPYYFPVWWLDRS